MMAVFIPGQFDLNCSITACVREEVRVYRADGLKVPLVRDKPVVRNNWMRLCDEIDYTLRRVNEAKRVMRNYGLLPVFGLLGVFIFILVYSSAKKSRFLLSFNLGSIMVLIIAINCVIILIVLEYRVRVRCKTAWNEVRYICHRYSSNVIQYRLKHKKFYGNYFSSEKYFLEISTPGDPGFVEVGPKRQQLPRRAPSNSELSQERDEENQHQRSNRDSDISETYKYSQEWQDLPSDDESEDIFQTNPFISSSFEPQTILNDGDTTMYNHERDEHEEGDSSEMNIRSSSHINNSYEKIRQIGPSEGEVKKYNDEWIEESKNRESFELNSDFCDSDGFLPKGFLSVPILDEPPSKPLTPMVTVPEIDLDEIISWESLGNAFTQDIDLMRRGLVEI